MGTEGARDGAACFGVTTDDGVLTDDKSQVSASPRGGIFGSCLNLVQSYMHV